MALSRCHSAVASRSGVTVVEDLGDCPARAVARGTVSTTLHDDELEFTGERFIPGMGAAIAYEHWARYSLAASLVGARDVLDVGCGEGYGAAMLADHARSVSAFDASPAAVAHARRVYARPGLAIQQATIESFFAGCSSEAFDVVVAFEVIEHVLPEIQALLLDGIRRVLRRDGVAILSTPDKHLYTDVPKMNNPFHLREFYRHEFESELRQRFTHVQLLDQALFTGCAVVERGADRVRAVQLEKRGSGTGDDYVRTGLEAAGMYVVALASNVPLPNPPSLVIADFSKRLMSETVAVEQGIAQRLTAELADARQQASRLESELEIVKRASASAEADRVRLKEEAQRLEGRLADLARDLELVRSSLRARHLPDQRSTRGLRSQGNSLRGLSFRALRRPLGALSSLREARRRRQEANLVLTSGLFDPEFYLAENPDVRSCGFDPLDHFLMHGAAEGRDPHPLFSIRFYRDNNPDVARSGVNPLVHFLQHGWRERRSPHPSFDVGAYLDRHPGVEASGSNPVLHYLEHG